MNLAMDIGAPDGAGLDVVDIASALSRAQTRRRAFDLFADFVRDLGFEDALFTIEAPAVSAGQQDRRWSTLDADRLAALDLAGFGGQDPVRRFACRSIDPFVWTSSEWPGVRSAATRDMMLAIARAGVGKGMTVAVWGRAGRLGIADAIGFPGAIEALSPAIRDRFFVAAALTFRMIEKLSLTPEGPPLTGREFEILELAAQGLTTRLIAQRLDVVEQTVKFHFRGIREKLKARNRSEAISRFIALDMSSRWRGAN